MTEFPLTLAHLDGASLGLFGVGHLGRAIGSGLVQNGFPISRLLVCHGGAPGTAARLAEEGLSERVVPAADLTRRSRIILYLVRPQNFNANMHAFTALGVCLPIAFACWTALGRSVDEKELIDKARGHGLAGFERILQWALEAEPRFQTRTEEEAYMKRATTPGGVTEAIIERINGGGSLAEALESGIRRSEALGAASA